MAIIKKFRITTFKKERPKIQLNNISFSFNKRQILEDISFMIREGEICGLLGPNGVGKSTIFNLITGLIKPDSGKIKINNTDVINFPIYLRTKQFKLGGNGAAYGASTDSGIGWAYKGDNGFSLSSNVVSKQNKTTNGFLTDESKTNWSTQVAYTTDTYHLSLITALKYNGWTDSYYTTSLGKARPDGNSTNYGLRGYWRPDSESQAIPEISAGYDISTVEGQDADTDAYFVGLTWKDTFQADDKIGIALGQPQTAETDTVTPFTWEAYYSYKLNDSITVSPAIFGATDRTGTSGVDITGAVVQTTFKF